ncbi:MAG: hypothetical protein EOL87_16540 [Spartobacteria bacterium]|nr:hypothetical protein [Spartobacteria bacterium]
MQMKMKGDHSVPFLLWSGLLICWMSCWTSLQAASYTYDVKNQMTSAMTESGQTLTFIYDVSGNITAVQVATAAKPAQPAPHTPTSSGGGITISWLPLTGAAVYDIWRSTSPILPTLDGVRADTATKVSTNLLQTTWKDTSVQPDIPYYYWIQGKNGAGSGDLSPMITATYTPASALSGTMLLLLSD